MKGRTICAQKDKNYAPIPYGMTFVQGKRKPVHLVIWAIIRDKQKRCKHAPYYVGAVKGLATLAGCGINTAIRAIEDLCREGWLIAPPPGRGSRTSFRAIHKGQGESIADISSPPTGKLSAKRIPCTGKDSTSSTHLAQTNSPPPTANGTKANAQPTTYGIGLCGIARTPYPADGVPDVGDSIGTGSKNHVRDFIEVWRRN